MKLVDRKTFLELPLNTVFAKWEPYTMGEISIKGETVADVDFYVQDLTQLEDTFSDNPQLDLYCSTRDGFFDEDQIFAVFDDTDVENLIARLTECL